MSRLTDALIGGGYNLTPDKPMLDLGYGGQGGWTPNLAELVSNQAYTSRPLTCILLEAPKLFTIMPDKEKWIASLKALFELHARSIDGFNAGLKVDTDEHPVGGAGEMQQEISNVTRERSQPKFTFIEKYGRPIQTLLEYWIRYGMMDPETKFALAGTLSGSSITDGLMNDWYGATCLFFVPDPLHKKIDKAWITTNMFPLGTGDIIGKRDLTSAQEILTLDIEFAGVSQFGLGVNMFAQTVLDGIGMQFADPYMKPSFAAGVSPSVDATGNGYKAWTETVGRTSVTNMG